MDRRSAVMGLALLGLAALGTAAAQQIPAPPAASAGPIVQAGTTRRLTTHVYAISDNSVPGVPNVGFVVAQSPSQQTLVQPNSAVVLTIGIASTPTSTSTSIATTTTSGP